MYDPVEWSESLFIRIVKKIGHKANIGTATQTITKFTTLIMSSMLLSIFRYDAIEIGLLHPERRKIIIINNYLIIWRYELSKPLCISNHFFERFCPDQETTRDNRYCAKDKLYTKSRVQRRKLQRKKILHTQLLSWPWM